MHATTLLLLFSSLGAPQVAPNTTMVYVTADWCGYCQEMKPTIGRMISEGYPVQIVNRDRNPQLANQLGVQGVPAFIVVQNQRVIDRTEGRSSYAHLVSMFPKASPTATQRQQPSMPKRAVPTSHQITRGQSPAASLDPRQLAMQASVKLKVSDPQGYSFGSGTIVHMHQGEGLILTCGHIFRDSQGQGDIEVTLFAPGATGPVRGRMISYDLKRDVALVSVRPNIAIEPVKLSTRGTKVDIGQAAFSIGCNKGNPASVMESRINSVNRYLGPDNLQAAGVPVDGRSGGGLFAADGTLIGVCNAADPQEQEGYYAAIPTIYAELDKMKIAHLFDQPRSQATAL